MARYGLAFLLWEASTPFVDVRHALKFLKLEAHWFAFLSTVRSLSLFGINGCCAGRVYRANAAAGYVMFFMVRVVFGLWLAFDCWRLLSYDARSAAVPLSVRWLCGLLAPTMCGLNLWWFGTATRNEVLPLVCPTAPRAKNASIGRTHQT